MKKFLALILLVPGCFVFSWCGQKTTNLEDGTDWKLSEFSGTSVNEVITNYLEKEMACDEESKTFINIAILWSKDLGNWSTEYYLVSNGDGFYINSRWDLVGSCWFRVPVTVTVSENKWTYTATNLVQAKDWSENDSSIKDSVFQSTVDFSIKFKRM